MINLLPPELKSGYHYARRNVTLRKWVVICFVALAGLGALATYGLLTLSQSSADYRKSNAAAEEVLQKEEFTATQKRLEEISSSFKLVVQVLSQEVLFSQLLKQVGATIPDGANLTAFNIAQTQGAIDISATATDYNTATQVQVNLADPDNKIFSKADIVSITCETKTEGGAAASQYPCSVTIRALFAPNNPFLFINSQGSAR